VWISWGSSDQGKSGNEEKVQKCTFWKFIRLKIREYASLQRIFEFSNALIENFIDFSVMKYENTFNVNFQKFT